MIFIYMRPHITFILEMSKFLVDNKQRTSGKINFVSAIDICTLGIRRNISKNM